MTLKYPSPREDPQRPMSVKRKFETDYTPHHIRGSVPAIVRRLARSAMEINWKPRLFACLPKWLETRVPVEWGSELSRRHEKALHSMFLSPIDVLCSLFNVIKDNDGLCSKPWMTSNKPFDPAVIGPSADEFLICGEFREIRSNRPCSKG